MADKIRGITIEIGGDTTGLTKALKGVSSEINSTQRQLKDVERLLKLDPTNTELLKQKQELLGKAVKETSSKLEELKRLQDTMDQNGVDKNSEQYMALQREIIATENSLESLTESARESNATLQKIGAEFDKISKGAEKAAQKTKAVSTAAAGLLAGIGGVAYSAITASDDLNTLAKQTGFTTAELQKMKYASDLVDVSVEDMTGSVKKMRKSMVSESSATQEAFSRIGVAVTDANGELRDSTTVFYEVLDGLSKVTNETERDTLAMQIFGKSADNLAGIIDDGGEALKNLGQQAEEAGLILSQDTLDSLNEVNDKIDTMKATVSGTIAEVGAKAAEVLFPVIEDILSYVEKLLDAIGEMSPESIKIVLAITTVVAAISPMLTAISKVTGAVSDITTKVIPKLVSAVGNLTNSVIPAIVSKLGVFGTLGIAAIIIALVTVITKYGQQIKEFIGKIADWITERLDKLGNWLRDHNLDVLSSAVNLISDAVKSIKSVLSGIVDFIQGVFTGNWRQAWQGVVNIFGGILDGIKAVAKAPINAVIGMINTAIKGINKLKSWVGGSAIATIPMLANGGVLSKGSAIVGEAGPEMLTMANGKAVVTPLTNSTTTNNNLGSVTINVYGAAGQNVQELASVIMDEIQAATERKGAVFS